MNNILKELYEIIEDRRENPIDKSYTNYLFQSGLDKILKKVGEESSEVIIASKNQDNNEVVSEMSDLIYHMLVLMVQKGVKLEEIEKELAERRKKIGNKKESKKIASIH